MRETIALKDVTNLTINTIRDIARAGAEKPGALLPILHAVQDEFGYLPEETIATVADVLNLSRADVHGVVSFYHLFRQSAPGEHTLFLCRAEACRSMGANRLAEHAKKTLGVDFHETTKDGRFSLEPIYCLGNCACAPAVMIDETVHGRVTPERLAELVD
ncbi:MAG: formate dehydrogenase subunit gamma [Pseudomonadales bacterium]